MLFKNKNSLDCIKLMKKSFVVTLFILTQMFCITLSPFIAVSQNSPAIKSLAKRMEKGTITAESLASSLMLIVSSEPEQLPIEFIERCSKVSGFSEAFGGQIRSTLISRLENRTAENLESVRKIASILYPGTSSIGKFTADAFRITERADKAVSNQDFKTLRELRTESSNTKSQGIVDRRLLRLGTEVAEKEIKENLPASAFTHLAMISDGVRNQKVLDLAKTATASLANSKRVPFSPENIAIFESETAISLARFLIIQDYQSRAATTDLLEKLVISHVNYNQIDRAYKLYTALIELRPDPDQLNDLLRYDIAFIAKSPNAHGFARGRIRELVAAEKLSFLKRMSLLKTGWYYQNEMLKALMLSFLIVSAAYISLKIRKTASDRQKMPTRRRKRRRVKKRQTKEEKEEKKREKRTVESAEALNRTDEYSALLSIIGLKDDASEEEINKQFRQMLRDNHPDNQVDGEKPKATDDFLEIQKAYDRIQQIRKGWFGE